VARTIDELLDADLDGVVIATPGGLHADQTLAAVQRGLAVFCQRPLAPTGAQARRVVEAARAADCLLHVDLSYRHLAASNALRRLVRSGALGRVRAVDAVFHAPRPDRSCPDDRPRAGAGCLIDLGVHMVDLALWIVGAPPVHQVSGRRYAGGFRLAAGSDLVEDSATARVELATGTTLSLACSWHVPAGHDCAIRLALHGTEGRAVLENVDGSRYEFKAERYRGTTAEVLAAPPDVWGGRAAVAWAYRLGVDRRFDAEAERFVEVASILDRIYAT
jgi:predicted dehydrogenase